MEDIPKLIDVWYTAFDMGDLFPDTPKVREWWNIGIHDDFKDSETQIYLKVVDTSTGRIAGYANWHWGDTIKTWKERYPPFSDDTNATAADAFFGGMDVNRQRIMGGKPHYCMCLLASCSNDKTTAC